MDHLKFFEKYVENFTPYQNNQTYQIIIDNFKKKFLKHSYEEIPKTLLDLYDHSVIDPSLYDKFLIDIGVSDSLIKELTETDKFIFLKSLSDFQKYKATVNIVGKVIKAYGDRISVYELYIDWDSKYNTWICKPYVLYKPKSADLYNKKIPYNRVYEKIPSLLIHENELNKIKDQNLAAFPIKTNILFINSSYLSTTNYIQNLIISVFFNHFKNHKFNLYFTNKLIQVNLHQFILAYLYILFSQTENKIERTDIPFYISYRNQTRITIEDLDEILEEYENIKDAKELYNFYNTYIDPFKRCNLDNEQCEYIEEDYYEEDYVENTKVFTEPLTKQVIERVLQSENEDLFNYIVTVLENYNNPIIYLIDSLLTSIEIESEVSSNLNFKKYFSYFKSFLPSINISASTNSVFKILYYLKPHHTEYFDSNELILLTSQDKLNNIYFYHIDKHRRLFTESSVVEIESVENIHLTLEPSFEDIRIFDTGNYSGRIKINQSFDEYQLIDAFNIFSYIDEIYLQNYDFRFITEEIEKKINLGYIDEFVEMEYDLGDI